MFKPTNRGKWSCIGHNGKKKAWWDNAEDAISRAKEINFKNNCEDVKLVAYKCPHCKKYHLTTKFKTKRKWNVS